MLDMIGSGRRFSSISLGLGGVEHDGIREAWEVADALVRICQRRAAGHGHSGGLLYRNGYILRVHVRGSADPGHGGEEVVVVVAHDVGVGEGSSRGRKIFLSRSRTGRPSSRSRRRQRKARDASFGMLGDFDDGRRGSESLSPRRLPNREATVAFAVRAFLVDRNNVWQGEEQKHHEGGERSGLIQVSKTRVGQWDGVEEGERGGYTGIPLAQDCARQGRLPRTPTGDTERKLKEKLVNQG